MRTRREGARKTLHDRRNARPLGERHQRQIDPQPAFKRQSQLDGHQRIHAHFGERPELVDPGDGQPQDAGRLLGDDCLEQCQGLFGVQFAKALDQRAVIRQRSRLAADLGKKRSGKGRQKAACLVPVGFGKPGHSEPAVTNRRQRRKSLRRWKRSGAETPRQRIAGVAPLREVAGILDGAPGDREPRFPFGPSCPRQRFKRAICRDISSLPRRPEQGRCRREQEEQLDRVVARQPVERDRTAELWPQDRARIGRIEFGGERIGNNRGGMHDTAQRRVPRPDLVENNRKRSRIGGRHGC